MVRPFIRGVHLSNALQKVVPAADGGLVGIRLGEGGGREGGMLGNGRGIRGRSSDARQARPGSPNPRVGNLKTRRKKQAVGTRLACERAGGSPRVTRAVGATRARVCFCEKNASEMTL